ncbi:MAG TPA: trypsin-like peptidase domain-containing protein [Thermoanaerobaculia bacterium]|nr:trypsin-like peptidase domain-containing protein [Thermoanaerobaculia bacterium]
MKRILWSGVIALAMVAAPSFAAAPDFDFAALGAQAKPETVGTPRDLGARAAEMQLLQKQLAAGRVDKAQGRPIVVRLTNAERRRIDDLGPVQNKYLVGVAKPVGKDINFAPARSLDKGIADLALGAARGTGGAGFVWTADVRVSGATALRLHLTNVDLPRGAKLYVYNLAGQAFGPYTGRGPLGDGELHTNTVFGGRLLLQLHAPADLARTPRLTLAEVGVMGARFAAPRYQPEGVFNPDDLDAISKASNLCSTNASCVVNAACQSSSVVNVAKDAVASILFQSGASFYICTGGLVADTVSTSVIPYFLTAHHCISSSGEASSLETYFDYDTTCSNPNCTQPYNNTGDTVGATIKATGSTSDFTLVQLASTPASRDGVTTYLGWLSTAVANTNNLALYRISHPKGSPQAYSEGVVDTSKPTCRTLARGNFIYSRDTVGATEGGSSGSPVLNGSGQIVGQLYGACGTNLNDVCDSANNATVDGAFAVSYPSLAAFLNPGTGSCGAAGSSCTSNSQCCSNSCKGKTCK